MTSCVVCILGIAGDERAWPAEGWHPTVVCALGCKVLLRQRRYLCHHHQFGGHRLLGAGGALSPQ